ncbi:expression site-associated gene (ESAG) protein, putative [Trypanosoma brucei brucei TREU927]|uniref:Expression site-associated gene (ESAG) protein, putative n=1 Tax=Trypanosoma brucei brucei (strain 927/4 GUTat10.1) TaxID=185431 RepID=Q57VG5_TRYB2|nr:expression site-associated gene (ESAG) protein, putative [Trypanosoma brucei brucei TREU927]AAX70404.1 expression site-associated gene (ESAG) protein, putative [Trypanosoma brucei]AAZ10609.1 expression site-associated gene (ESAG) protein, putative [Trypanosoma brucei brucei TREU927]
MKVEIVELAILLSFIICVDGENVEHNCKTVDDYYFRNINESVCYLSCLSNALNKLYSDGEKRLFVNEEAYANASRILDDMEGKTGESTKYLSVISSVMEGEHDKLEKLISYGNQMGDLAAKAGGLFVEVNESVRAVRKEIRDALIQANKYYTAVAEIAGTVWAFDGQKVVEGDHKCDLEASKKTVEFQSKCSAHTCPLRNGVNKSTLQQYKNGCLEISVMHSHIVDFCHQSPRNVLYVSGAVKDSGNALKWKPGHAFFLTIEVKGIFSSLIASFTAGHPPPVLLAMVSNMTLLYSLFSETYSNFTSLLLGTSITDNLNSTDSTT